jgi:polysaccharide deacetylase 2 family uncharacterized protein YibQ
LGTTLETVRYSLAAIFLLAHCSTLSANHIADYEPPTNSHKTNTYKVKVAIIIDDIGYSYHYGLRAINLPGAITYAIIPHSPKAKFFALEAHKLKKEVMLHAPMSNVHNRPLGQSGLKESMAEGHFKQVLNTSLDSLPNIRGMNNHMGSLLTQKSKPMQWVMEALQKRALYFIDSRTTADSVAWETAQIFNIPSLKRDVFLDHTPENNAIDKQFNELIAIAKRRGYAIAIGHPYPETIRYLQKVLPTLKNQGVELVPASELVKNYSPNLLSQYTPKM